MKLPSLLCLTLPLVLGCITEIDPVCESEMAKLNEMMPDPEAGIFFGGLVEFVKSTDGRNARNAMIPHILRGILDQECQSGAILNHIINSEEDAYAYVQPSELFLGKTDLLQWITPDNRVKDADNRRYNPSVIETLRNIAEQDFRPYFDAVQFDPDLALAVTFAFTACVDECVSFGYAFAMDGKETKFYTTVTAADEANQGIGVGSLGFDYSIKYDFLGSIHSVAGISSSVRLGGAVSGRPLTAMDEVLLDVNIPTGASFGITYNGALPGMDCIAMGLTFNTVELDIEASLVYAAEIRDADTHTHTHTMTCPSDAFHTEFGKAALNEACTIDEHCAKHGLGLGLTDVACCGHTCQHKRNGVCPHCTDSTDSTDLTDLTKRRLIEPRAIGAGCSLHTDCDDWGWGTHDVACCSGICTRKLADWAGVGYCPNECVVAVGCPQGSCVTSNAGQGCGCDQQCAGNLSCCDGYCEAKKQDWIGAWYCPKDCVGSIFGSAGSC